MNDFDQYARGVETWDEFQHRDEEYARYLEAQLARREAEKAEEIR